MLLTLLLLQPCWLWAKPTVELATDSYPPYYGKDLKEGGGLSAISHRAFELAGYKLKLVFVPWKRAVEHARMGLYDGVMAAYFTPERTEDFIYTNSIGEDRVVFFARKDKSYQFTSIHSLKGLKVGVINGYSYSSSFDYATDIIKIKANSLHKNMERLLAGRIDLLVTDERVGIELLKNRFPEQSLTNIRILTRPLIKNRMYIILPKNNPNAESLRNQFNQALLQMKTDGTLDKIIAQYKRPLSGVGYAAPLKVEKVTTNPP